jgi:hypothetical protein
MINEDAKITALTNVLSSIKAELRKEKMQALRAPKEGEGEAGGGDAGDGSAEGGFGAEVAALINALQNEQASLFEEFGETFTPTERERHISIGIKNLGFVQTAYQQAVQNPALVPAFLDMIKFKETIDSLERKRGILTRNGQFGKTVSDSILLDSDSAYHFALELYNYVKVAAKQKVPGAEMLYGLLKPFFKKSKPQNAEPTEKQIERDVRGLLKGSKEGRVVIENENPERTKGIRTVIDESRPDDKSVYNANKSNSGA